MALSLVSTASRMGLALAPGFSNAMTAACSYMENASEPPYWGQMLVIVLLLTSP